MDAAALLLAIGVLGVDFGWQPDERGGVEYIIQIEPQLLAAMRRGEEVVSDILPHVQNVRRFRIRIGNKPLPRHTPATWSSPPVGLRRHAGALIPRPQVLARTLAVGPEPQGTFREVELAAHEIAALPARTEPATPRRNPLLGMFSRATLPRSSNMQPDVAQHTVLRPVLRSDPPQINGQPDTAKGTDAGRIVRFWFLLGLCASIGLNGFLGWMWMSFYRKYRTLLGAGE